jgi:CRISPR-associated protein Cas2
MIVIRLENAPFGLRGDLTKWLLEIDSGVFVGQVNARVRDNLWSRILEYVKNGRAIMVYSTNNEQGLEFKVHGSQWEPIDFDGIKLMLRPSPSRLKMKNMQGYHPGGSRAAKQLIAKRAAAKATQHHTMSEFIPSEEFPDEYIVIDVETTGFNNDKDEIIEFGAAKVRSGKIIEEFIILVKPSKPLSTTISELTGITQIMLDEKGVGLDTALRSFLEFIGQLPCIAHNAAFDYGFIRAACAKCKINIFANRQFDTLVMSKKLIPDIRDRKLKTLAEYFGINESQFHRSVGDCAVTAQVFEQLKELNRKSKNSG